MLLTSLAYVSSAVRLPDAATLDALLADSREYNRNAEVTGALLYQDGCFFQYLEGPPAALDLVYARIRAARLHRDLILLVHRKVDQRHFAAWHMGFAEAPRSLLQSLAQAHWSVALQGLDRGTPADDGLFLLLEFWQRTPGAHCAVDPD